MDNSGCNPMWGLAMTGIVLCKGLNSQLRHSRCLNVHLVEISVEAIGVIISIICLSLYFIGSSQSAFTVHNPNSKNNVYL